MSGGERREPVYTFLMQHPRKKGHTWSGKALARQNRRVWACVDCMAGIRDACRQDCDARDVVIRARTQRD